MAKRIRSAPGKAPRSRQPRKDEASGGCVSEAAERAQPRVLRMSMFLQDPIQSDLIGEYGLDLETDYIVGQGSSSVCVRDTDAYGNPQFPERDWSRESDLTLARFQRELARLSPSGELSVRDAPHFHQVNVFAVVRHTLDFVEAEIGAPIEWRSGQLILRPHAFEGANAHYDPASVSLNFGYFRSPFLRAPIWTCLSHDIITHELGHAILDNLRPWFLHAADPDTVAFHEAFADVLAMLSALEHEEVVARLFDETKGDLAEENLVSRLAEELGIGLRGASTPYLREATASTRYHAEQPFEPHERSRVFTSAVFGILRELLPLAGQGEDRFPARVRRASGWLQGLLLRTLPYLPPTGVSLPVVAALILVADERVYPKDASVRDVARAVFASRGLLDDTIDFAPGARLPTLGDLRTQAPGALRRLVFAHAEGLGIPLALCPRLIDARLRTTHRTRDREPSGKVIPLQDQILEYVYELVVIDGCGQPVSIFRGGCLVLDGDGRPQLLVRDPSWRRGDRMREDGVPTAEVRAYERLLRIYRRRRRRAAEGPLVDGLHLGGKTPSFATFGGKTPRLRGPTPKTPGFGISGKTPTFAVGRGKTPSFAGSGFDVPPAASSVEPGGAGDNASPSAPFVATLHHGQGPARFTWRLCAREDFDLARSGGGPRFPHAGGWQAEPAEPEDP